VAKVRVALKFFGSTAPAHPSSENAFAPLMSKTITPAAIPKTDIFHFILFLLSL
jgi:hypothetical protein